MGRLFGWGAPAQSWAAGLLEILHGDKTGFFCSSQCPGGVILKTFDAITAMHDEGRTLRRLPLTMASPRLAHAGPLDLSTDTLTR
jgi:hypothetical protein